MTAVVVDAHHDDADPTAQALARAAGLQSALARNATPAALEQARDCLLALRRLRLFGALLPLAEAVCRVDPGDADSRILYAQALAEQGLLSAALALVESLTATLAPDRQAWGEAWGLAGRCHKQQFFDAVRAGGPHQPQAWPALARAAAAYAVPYRHAPRQHVWHGANLLGIVMRARADGHGEVAPDVDPAALAAALLAHTEPAAAGPIDPWQLATRAEAALGSTLAGAGLQPVEAALRAYLQADGVSAFHVQSTLRQFTELWNLDDLQPGLLPGLSADDVAALRRLPDLLRARLLQLPGGELRVAPAALAPAAASAAAPAGVLEAVLGADGAQTFAWWRAGVDAARSVAVVRRRLGKRLGSGFLVRAGDVGCRHRPDELLLLTNFHVVNAEGSGDAVKPADAEVVFEAEAPGRACNVEAIVWSSPVKAHDAALLRLDGVPPGLQPLPIGSELPPLPAPEDAKAKKPRVYVIGYPGGRELSFSFQDNELIDHEGPPAGKPGIEQVVRVHYRAPTEGGSSGSPVFDDSRWRVIALHHMGGRFGMPRLNGAAGSYAANEGLAMATLAAAVARDTAATTGETA